MLHTPCPLTRRQFGLSLCTIPFAQALRAEEFAAGPWNDPATVAVVYMSGPAHWPKPTLDVKQDVAAIAARLAEVQRKHTRNVHFIGGDLVQKADEAAPWLARMGAVDGVLMIPVTSGAPVGAMVEALNVPALYFSPPYASHGWSAIAEMRKRGKKLDVLATTSYGDLDPYMRMFRTAHHLRNSKVIVGVSRPEVRKETAEAYSRHFGTTFKYLTLADFQAAFDAADARQAQKEADAFVAGALRVVEPTPKEIRDGLRFYLAVQNLLKQEKANAISIDCFGTIPANQLPGYPCIAWSKLNDAGLYGVCEADLASTMTQILLTSYSGMPGFVSDPVFDVSRNEVIHAHCVSATKMKGVDGPSSPYIIRNHLETNEGAVLQVVMPSDETITVARFHGPAKLLISTAEVTGPVDSDRGCRSQIRTRVADAEKWLQNYTAGLHRVIFYGDHLRVAERMGRLLGFEVTREV